MSPSSKIDPLKLGGGTSPATPAESPATASIDPLKLVKAAPEKEKKGFFTRSLVGTENVEQIAKKVSGAVNTFTSILPAPIRESKEGQWAHKFTQSLVEQGGTGVLDFATSPAGIALMAAHLFPVTAPVAAVADLALGGEAAVQAIPDTVKFSRDRSPENAAQVVMDLIAAKGMKEVGSRTLGKSLKRSAEKPGFNEAVIQAAQGQTEHSMKMATLEAAKPKAGVEGLKERIKERVYSVPLLKNFATLSGAPLPKLVEISSNVVEERNARLLRMEIESNRMLHSFRKAVPAAERDIEKMGYVIEGSATAKEVGLSPQATAWVDVLREYRKNMDDLVREAYGHEMPMKDAETYLTHLWDFGPGVGSADIQHAARTLIKDPFFKQRSIETYKQGMTDPEIRSRFPNLKPRFRDVADVIQYRDQFARTAASNSFMADTLRSMGVILSEDEYRQAGLNGWKRAGEAHALDRAVYLGGKRTPGVMRGGTQVKPTRVETIMTQRPVMVHPEFSDAVNAIFTTAKQGELGMALDGVRSMSKKLRLSFSFFHHNALGEQAHAIDILRKPGRLLKDIYVFNPEAWKGMRSGLWEVAEAAESRLADPSTGKVGRAYSQAVAKTGKALGTPEAPPSLRLNPDMVNPWIEHGLQLSSGEAESMLVNRLQDLAHSSSKVKRAIGTASQPMADLMRVWDRSLWDFYHQGLMINSAEAIWADEMGRALKSGKTPSPGEMRELRRSVAKHVNDSFGAVNYQNLLQSPKAIRAMNYMLLAPAWTLSNMRVISHAFENEAGARIAGKWAVGAAMSWFLTTQAMNYGMTSYYNMPDRKGKRGGHFSWDNPGAPMYGLTERIMTGLSENALNVAAGYNESTGKPGTERYLKLGRAYREPFLWMMDPANTFGNKLGQFPRTGIEMFSGHSPGGYEIFDPAVTSLKKRIALLMTEAATPMPLVDARNHAMHYLFPESVPAPTSSSSLMGFPSSAGLTVKRAVRAYTQAKDEGNDDAADMIMDAAILNNLNTRSIIQGWRQEMTKRIRTSQGPQGDKYDTFGKRIAEEPPPGAKR